MSALVVQGVPIECINKAAIVYHVPASLIISVLSVEGGEVGMASPNRNGTYDYGPMQINTIWLSKIKPYGYTAHDIQYDGCANVTVGTWILSQNIADSANLWRGVGGYHSYTPMLNEHYQAKVWHVYALLAKYLATTPPASAKSVALVPSTVAPHVVAAPPAVAPSGPPEPPAIIAASVNPAPDPPEPKT